MNTPDPQVQYQRALSFQRSLVQAFGQNVVMPPSVQSVLMGGPSSNAATNGDLTPPPQQPAQWLGPKPQPVYVPNEAGVTDEEKARRVARQGATVQQPDIQSLLAATQQQQQGYQTPTLPGSTAPQATPLSGAELTSPQWHTGGGVG